MKKISAWLVSVILYKINVPVKDINEYLLKKVVNMAIQMFLKIACTLNFPPIERGTYSNLRHAVVHM